MLVLETLVAGLFTLVALGTLRAAPSLRPIPVRARRKPPQR